MPGKGIQSPAPDEILIQPELIPLGAILANHYFTEVEELKPDGINLSLDALRSDRFLRIARRNYFNLTDIFLKEILQADLPLKIYSVIQSGIKMVSLQDRRAIRDLIILWPVSEADIFN